jgi:signal transduction histidine kinase
MKNTFGKDIIPPNENERLQALKRYEILDTPPEKAFDRIAALAARLFNAPIALVSLVDEERVFFKANVGMEGVNNIDRGVSLCSLAILDSNVTVFENAETEPCLLANPLVAGSFGLKFYAGAPIVTPDGYNIGTVCIVDKKPRAFTEEQREILKELSGIIMDEIEVRLAARRLVNETNEKLQNTQAIRLKTEVDKEILFNLVMQIPAAIAIFRGPEHVFELVNPLYHQMVGKRELIGKPIREVFPEFKGQGFFEVLDSVYKTGLMFTGNELLAVIEHENGRPEEGYFNFIYQPIIGAGGEAEGVLSFAYDVTEQVRARKFVEANAKRKDDFLGIASHELKTPLTSIKAYIHLIEQSFNKQSYGNAGIYIHKVNNLIDRLTTLISDLLDVTKIQNGKIEFNITQFDFDELAHESIESVQHSSHKHRIIKQGQLSRLVKGDKDRIQQVFVNLLTNAVKYSPKADEVVVNISCDSKQVQVAVTDFGIGIPKSKQEHIFQMFYRVEESELHFQGLGIGLHVSNEIIKRHSGKLWVESDEGKGSTFYFTLPLN